MTNSDINIQSGERLSFYQMFKQKDYHIEIPIIQRDYAQGRESKTVVRETFLDALHQYLTDNKPNRDLDFVYGSLSNNGCIKFIPLDGQQRLTTLFLLHWYLSNLAEKQSDFRSVMSVKDGEQLVSKFTYETRTSSREFCDELIRNDFDMSNLLSPDKEKSNELSKTIMDKGWYYLSWQNDPTIQSMLTMLDAIHLKFKNNPEFYNRLTNLDSPIITFLFLNLEEFKLTDDLYIKMNARGKPLTTFENFKARFEKYINSLSWDKEEHRTLKRENSESIVHPREYFSFKIDTTWANLFWHYRNVNGKDNAFDDELMNFIRVLLSNEYAGSNKNTKFKPNLEYIVGTSVARKKKGYTDDISFHQFKELGVLSKEAIDQLMKALDVLSNGDNSIHKHLPDCFYYNEESIFKETLKHNLNFPQRIQFHAYLKFLIKNGNKTEELYQWMRVIYNLTENNPIDGVDEYARAIKSTNELVKELEKHNHNILELLKNSMFRSNFYTGRQLQEERIKAHLLGKGDNWKVAIENAETHSYFKGQIGFLLEFSGILKYFEENNSCDWDDDNNAKYLDLFTNYSEKASCIFTIINSKGSHSIDYLWERAILTKGDYSLPATANRKNLLSTSKNMRDFSWKRLLRIQQESEKNPFKWIEKRELVKQVFDDSIFDHKNIKSSLTAICKNTPNDWRRYFVENPEIIKHCKQGFIKYSDDHDIRLYGESQSNHIHAELYTYVLWEKYINPNKESYRPFDNLYYQEVRSIQEFPHIVLPNFWHNKIQYHISIYYYNNDSLPHPYEIAFQKTKGTNHPDKYGTHIKTALDAAGFKWSENLYPQEKYIGYYFSCNSDKEVIEKIKQLNIELLKL
ncbi:MAG: DUF262 domain-containing protein [Bacteroidales bacterium]